MTDFKKWFAARARNPEKITLEEAFDAGASAQQRAQPVPSIPDGWKLVPIEPTQEMSEAGVFAGSTYYDVAEATYEAMLAAAPEAKA